MSSKARLRLFGSPCLLDCTGRRIALPSKAFVLALLLLTSGRGLELARSQLASALWPDAPNPSANLRQLLRRVATDQREAGIGLFAFDRVNVRLNVGDVLVDLIELRREIENLDWANCRAVLEMYRDGLLSEATPPEGDLSARIEGQRSRIRDQVVASFGRLLEQPDARVNPRTVQAVASRLLEIDPYQEAAYRSLMRSFANDGHAALVTATFEKCRDLLERDLRAQPSPVTISLYRSLVPGSAAPRHGEPAHVAAPAEPPATALMRRATLPRLVVLAPPPGGGDQRLRDIATLVLEDVIIGLCGLKTVSVIAPHTSWQLSNGGLDEETANRFNIGYVLESTARRRDKVDCLSVTLFDARTRDILWAGAEPLSPRTSAECYRTLAVRITLSLADAVERTEIIRFDKDLHPQAYFWHLIGQKYLRHVDLPNVRRAAKAFRGSVVADPDFAPGHSGLARAIQREWLVLGRGDVDLLDDAARSGARAVSLDHRDARGYREIALCNLYRRRWDEAIANFSEAERLSPQHADLITDFGDALGHCGEPEEGLKKIERAMELDPIPPDQYWWNKAGLHYRLGQYAAAIAAVEHMSHRLPGLRVAAASWARLGQKSQAAKCAKEFLESYPDFRIDRWLSMVPDRYPDDTRHYELGLRKAGFK